MEAAIKELENKAEELRQNVGSYTKLETERRAALEATQAIRASNEQSLAQVMAALDVLKANVGHKPPPRLVPSRRAPSLLTPCLNCQHAHWTDEPCAFPPPAPVPTSIQCDACGTFFLSNQEHQCVRLSNPPAPVPPPSVCPACDHAHYPGEKCIGVAVGAGGGVVKLGQEAPRGSSYLLSDEPLPSDKGPHDDSEILY